MHARDLMTSPVITASSDTPVRDVVALLLEHRISGLPIVDDGKVVGVLSESDLLRRAELGTERRRSRWLEALIDPDTQAADFAQSRGTLVRDVMTRDVISVEPATEIGDIASIFEHHRIKRVPVIDEGRLVGIISRANLLRALMVYKLPAPEDARSDQSIAQALTERLSQEAWLDVSRINIVVRDGTVHLWGTVRSDEQRRALEAAALSCSGVTRVQNHTTRDIFANTAG
jgi:CBS-domain-containing membrane protein